MHRIVLVVLGLLLGTRGAAVDPIGDGDCKLCLHIVKHIEDTEGIKRLACSVLKNRDDAVDAAWKLHSSAFLAKDGSGRIASEIKSLTDQGIDPRMICGVMGVQSSSDGCACPATHLLKLYEGLESAINMVRDDAVGKSPSDVAAALNCEPTSSSLLELARRVNRVYMRRRKAAIQIQNTNMCTGERGKGEKNIKVMDTVKYIQPRETSKRKIGSAALGVGSTGVGIGLTILNPIAGAIFGICWGALSFMGGEKSEEKERAILRQILERAHYVLNAKMRFRGEQMSILDLAKTCAGYAGYKRAVKDLGMSFDNMQRQEANSLGTDAPPAMQHSKAISVTNFLLELSPIPGLQTGLQLVLDDVLSDVYSNRAITVMYLMHCFYLEALIRNEYDPDAFSDIESARRRPISEQPNPAHGDVRSDDRDGWKYNRYGYEKIWLNMDVFEHFLEDDLLEFLNGEDRGNAFCGGVDNLCCAGGRKGSSSGGSKEECESLKKKFRNLRLEFLQEYIVNGHDDEIRSSDPGERRKSKSV